MTNTLEQNRKIIADAPEGANEHNEIDGYTATMPKPKRSLQDIRENIALQERVAELESQCDELAHDLNAKEYECRAYGEKIESLESVNQWQPRDLIENYDDGQICWVDSNEGVTLASVNEYPRRKLFQRLSTHNDEGMMGFEVYSFIPVVKPKADKEQ